MLHKDLAKKGLSEIYNRSRFVYTMFIYVYMKMVKRRNVNGLDSKKEEGTP